MVNRMELLNEYLRKRSHSADNLGSHRDTHSPEEPGEAKK